MPQELRERLSASAGTAGRSLNREIVHRLEESLETPDAMRRQKKGDSVKRLRSRRPLVALAIVVLAAAAIAVVGARQHVGKLPGHRPYLKAGDPDARAAIGKTGNLGSPISAEAQEIAELAYPSSSLQASQLTHERDFFHGKVRGRGKFHGDRGWQLVGPSTATVPAVLNVFDNQAGDFGVSGRVTALAIDPGCDSHSCRIWLAAAGGGIWRSDNALSSDPHWTFLSDNFGTNAIGTLVYDAPSHTLYAGTGEPNASGDSESGVGIYASHDNGNRWSLLPGSVAAMNARSISSIAVDPSHPGTLYVGTTRGVRGVSSVTGGAVSLAPDAAPWGLYKTTDGGQHFTEVWDGHASLRGVNHVELDSHGTVYAAAFQQGIWRSPDGGSTWEQVFATQDPTDNAARTEFSLTTTPDGHTRIYVGDGGTETGTDGFGLPLSNSGVYRADSIDTAPAATLTDGVADPGYTSLTSANRSDPGWATYDYCEGQCWYDNFIVSPPGHPDMVYVGGSFDYNLYSFADNGKAVLLSQDAGATWTDQTRDNAATTTGIHPDQHALVVDPANPLLFFEGSDGGIVHSSGQLTDATANCPTGFGDFSDACLNLLKAVPTQITSINKGLSTLQYQSVSVNPSDPTNVMGGTQDNGTWNGSTRSSSWLQTIYGDGGQSGYDSGNSSIRFTNFYSPFSDVNFENGDPTAWVIASGTFFDASGNPKEASAFYLPEIADPSTSGTLFTGLQHVWRTLDNGGDKATLEASCPEFTTFGGQPGCGDFAPLGDPSGNGGPGTSGDLTSTLYGADRAGGYVVAVARTPADHSTLWAATATGRVFVSQNANAPSAADVTYTRIDSTSTAAPQRFVSGIVIDPRNPNRAWVTYTGYNTNTPSTPGHVFQVDYNPSTHTATWTDIDNGTGPLGDLPATGIARDDATGTLYVATDFTVLADSPNFHGTFDGNWRPAASGLPEVEVAGVTINQRTRTLFAATHGRAIWSLALPSARGGDHGH